MVLIVYLQLHQVILNFLNIVPNFQYQSDKNSNGNGVKKRTGGHG